MEKEINKELIDKTAKPNIERNILAVCLKSPEKIIDVKSNGIKGDMFLIEANRYIYYAIDYLFSKQQTPTPVAIVEVLKDKKAKKAVEDFGGVDYLSILQEQRVDTNNIAIFCEKLKQAYTRCNLAVICEENIDFLMSDKVEVLNPTEIVSHLEEKVGALTLDVQKTNDVYKIGDELQEALDERAEHPNAVPGLEMGWNKLDYYTNGGQPGDLWMVCARPKEGKSTLLTNWATKLAIYDRLPVLYFDTEMLAREQEDRILSILSGVPLNEIYSGMYVCDTENGKAEHKIESIRIAGEMMRAGNYYHIYMPDFTIEKVNAVARKFKMQYNIQAIFFDYLKFPAAQMAMLKQASEWQMLGYIASGLKDLAGTLEIPIYSACQQNRTAVGAEKMDSTMVGGSDRIFHLVSKLMFLYGKTEEEIMKEGEWNGNTRLYIAAQRNGESDCPPINIRFDKPKTLMEEV